ncbi:uncharacterized protein LOC143272659 [Peromyscus maniculatus bairdii]|uniref:uncharacterized protein LOC143272659 n=1 Tax=Peromyscus maniculatus bairdii TaxID=230844 RepID=UPI003FD30BCE
MAEAKKSTLSEGRAVSDSSTSAKVRGAGLGRDHREGGSQGRRSSASGSLEKSRESLPGGRWARPPPLQGPRRAGGPLPPGPARRPGRGRGAPRRDSGARGWTLPTSAAPRLSPNLGFDGATGSGSPGQALAARLVLLTHPPPGSGHHQPELRAPPTDTGCGKSSLGSGSRLARRTPYRSHPPALFTQAPSEPQTCPPVRPRVFTGTRGGDDSSVPPLRWQPVPSPDYSD